MPYRKEQFVNGEIYHLVIRAIDDNQIFKDLDDHYRAIFSIYEFNNIKPVEIRERRKFRAKIKKETNGDPISVDFRDKLVEVLVFCIMPNHLHLLVRQLKDEGITKFMAKLGIGYGGYFNRKYGRKGYVFQNRFLAIHIKNEEQLKTVFVYIHTNPISLIEPKWKELGIKNPQECIKNLENYKWSSYSDYLGKKNFPSVSDRGFMLKLIGGEISCKEFVESWVRYKSNIKEFPRIALES